MRVEELAEKLEKIGSILEPVVWISIDAVLLFIGFFIYAYGPFGPIHIP